MPDLISAVLSVNTGHLYCFHFLILPFLSLCLLNKSQKVDRTPPWVQKVLCIHDCIPSMCHGSCRGVARERHLPWAWLSAPLLSPLLLLLRWPSLSLHPSRHRFQAGQSRQWGYGNTYGCGNRFRLFLISFPSILSPSDSGGARHSALRRSPQQKLKIFCIFKPHISQTPSLYSQHLLVQLSKSHLCYSLEISCVFPKPLVIKVWFPVYQCSETGIWQSD